jgi:uncharacterized protein (DUF1697 family)
VPDQKRISLERDTDLCTRLGPVDVTRYAAFLRGINVSGRRVSGADLCACFEQAGMRDVATFLASGNVVFEDVLAGRSARALTRLLEEQLEATLGFAVSTFLRDGDEVRTIAAYEPFPADIVTASAGKLQVVMLRDVPSAAARRQALAGATENDPLAIEGRELYWLPHGGTQQSRLDWRPINAAVGEMTMRTKNTVERIAAKFF